MVGEPRGAGKRRIKPADASVLEYLLSHQEQNTDDESADSDWSESKAKRRRGSGDESGDKGNTDGTDASSDDMSSSSSGSDEGSAGEEASTDDSSSVDDEDDDEVCAARCAVCLLEGGDEEEQEMQTCYRCGINVHIVCYGNAKDLTDNDEEEEEEDGGGDDVWFCEPCLAESKARSCLFCPSSHGALKQVRARFALCIFHDGHHLETDCYSVLLRPRHLLAVH